MVNNIKEVECELNKYPLVRKYFYPLIRRVLQASDTEQNILIGLLSDSASESKENLKQLENVLELGNSNCENFKKIFHGVGSLDTANLKKPNEAIHNVLTEIEAFEYLHNQNFTNIAYILRDLPRPTVDFVAYRNTHQYAIEASRISLPQSQRKQVASFFSNKWIKALSSEEAKAPFFNTLFPKIKREYSQQVEPFCRAKKRCRGIVLVSTGGRFFISQWTRDEFYMLPMTTKNILPPVWQELKKNNHCPYLYHIVFIVERNLTYTYPDFLSELKEQVDI
jgi:hypothetical protein